jgi:NitT/TauT family transport system ATP-binding protein
MIGYVPQNTLIFPWLSVIDNIRLPFMIHKQLPDDARVTQLVEALQIREFLRTEVTKLSGGMAARVATARALVLKPRLLLIDEAFAALDEFLRYEVWLNVSMEMQDGVTIFVTHSVSDAAAFASHAVVLDNKAPSRTTSVSLQPTKLSYPPLQSNTMSENITAIRHALYP